MDIMDITWTTGVEGWVWARADLLCAWTLDLILVFFNPAILSDAPESSVAILVLIPIKTHQRIN